MPYPRLLAIIFATAVLVSSSRGLSQSSAPQPSTSQPPVSAPPAQSNAGPDAQGREPLVRVRTDEVNVVFTVVDKHGRFVKDLTQEQFRILDNRLPPRQIVKFEAQTNLPLRMGLLIDASTSIRDKFKFEQQAAMEFLQGTIKSQTDKAFVLSFDETWELTQDFTGDTDKLANGIRMIKPGGSTALWDAIYWSCREKLLKEHET